MNPIVEYFRIVIEDGDWLNDWLTHLPENVRAIVSWIGYLIAMLIGS
jgi:hypothetical protein